MFACRYESFSTFCNSSETFCCSAVNKPSQPLIILSLIHILLVDEAYHYFYPNTFIKYALEDEHVFVTRTFSKLFSLAGCRLGYVAGWPEGVNLIQKLCTPHNTNAFAMKFAEAIIKNPDVLNSLISNFNEGRK